MLRVESSLVEEFSISIEIKNPCGTFWWLTGVYGPNKQAARNWFWDELSGLSITCGRYWCLASDFNVTRYVHEKFKSPSYTRSMILFCQFIGELELIDPPLANAQFTWSNMRDDPICCRLDRFLFSTGWEGMFNSNRQEAMVRAISDLPYYTRNKLAKMGPSPFQI